MAVAVVVSAVVAVEQSGQDVRWVEKLTFEHVTFPSCIFSVAMPVLHPSTMAVSASSYAVVACCVSARVMHLCRQMWATTMHQQGIMCGR